MPVTLTPQQRDAVENRGGSLLVSAAAGSGKTRVLVDRLFRYVTEERYNVDDFLIITYTRAAAAELRGKIAAELSRRMGEAPSDLHLRRQHLRVYQADIKTVDAFCTALLRENTHLLAREGDRHALTPDFRVLDDSEALLIRDRVLNRVLSAFYEDLTPGGEQLADTLGAGRDDSALVKLVLALYDKLQSHASPADWLRRSRTGWERPAPTFDATPYAQALLASVRRRSAHWAEQLRRGAERTEGDPALASGYGAKFLAAARSFQDLSQAPGWEAARQLAGAVTFPRLATPKGRKEDPLLVSLKQLWEGAKAALKPLRSWLDIAGEEALEDLRAVAPAMLALLDLTAAFSEAFRTEKLRLNAADFSDQEHLALDLLVRPDGSPTELGEQVSARYAEILVDEYQDTNEVQNAIFRAVSKEGKNLFTVGDVKQSIYRFRLADPTIFLAKYAAFRPHTEAAEGEDRKLVLSQNFRSRREILDAANFLFENILSVEMGELEYNEDAALHFGAAYYPPRTDCETEYHLLTAVQKSEEDPHPVKKLTAEARFTALRIRELLDTAYPVTAPDGTLRPCRPEDIVILMRSPGSRTAVFAAALAERNIPCSFQEDSGFYDTIEISTVVSLLELIDNPRQDVPLISVLRSPVFGFTPDRLAELRAGAPEGEFYDAVAASGDCAAFLETLASLRRAAQDMSVHRLLWHMYNTLNLLGIFGAMDSGLERRENLITLTRQAEKFESGGCRGLFAFVTRLRRLLEAGKAPAASGAAAPNGVRLMSIHSSKGLEFPIVLLADLDHGFSRQDFDTPVLVHPKLGLGPRLVDLKRKIRYPTLARTAIEEQARRENLAEEQRVLYVAMTRPKEKLILIHSLYFAPTRLQRLAASAACPVPPETVASCRSFGEWILLPLLCRPEGEPLRTLSGAEVPVLPPSDFPWRVEVHDANAYRDRPARPETVEEESRAAFDPALLSFEYPYRRESALPAKLTATQLKGRPLDEEIAENAAHTPYLRPLSQPGFRRREKGLTPAERGSATHLVLQYLDMKNPDVPGQIAALADRSLLTPQQARAVDIPALRRLLASPLAEELRAAEAAGRKPLREYRFTLLVPASSYDAQAAPEDSILLQGVADLCFETEEGLTVVDFKTDHVYTAQEIAARAEHYRPQLEAYSLALTRVLEKPVVRRVLYFLGPGKIVDF
ncbi:helicase-exonuclease AddAB subunit AddA [Oscillospiraceae bacterium 38-13]